MKDSLLTMKCDICNKDTEHYLPLTEEDPNDPTRIIVTIACTNCVQKIYDESKNHPKYGYEGTF